MGAALVAVLPLEDAVVEAAAPAAPAVDAHLECVVRDPRVDVLPVASGRGSERSKDICAPFTFKFATLKGT